MVLGICVDKPTPLRDPKFACPKGAGTPSAGQAANKDNAVPGPFFDTAKLAVPPGTCTPCLDKGVFTAECPAGTACDAAVFETGLCLPVVRTEYDAHADGTATCSGKQPAGAKVSSPGECASCWIDARTSTCGPAPTGFLAAVAQVPKGWKVNLGSDKNSGEYRDSFPDWVPFREDSGLSGYRAYTEDGALLKTYAYASCAATKGRTADLRPEYGSKETLESGALVEWAAAWDRAFSGACDCGGKTARAVPPSAEKVGRQAPQQCPGIAQGCMQFVSGTCDRGITADAKAALGDALRCEAACEVRSEIAWLGSSQGWLAAADNLVAPLFDGMQASLLGALERLAGQGKADGTVFRFGFGFAGMVHWAFLDALATAALADAGARNGVDVGAGDRAAGSPLWGPLLALLGSSLDSIVPIMDNTSPSRQEFYYVFWQEGELSFKPATEVNQGGDKLKAYLKSSLDATLKVFRDRLLNDINKDRMRLYYFHAMDAASGIGISGDYALGKAGEVAGAVAAAAGRRYLRQVIPSFWDVCTVDQWDSWVPTDGITQSCATSKAGAYGVCPDWCGDKDSSTFEYAGNPSWAWSGGDEDPLGGTFPPFSAPWYRYREPKPDDWRLYANGQTTGTVVRSYYWPCGGAKGSGGPDDGGFTSLLEGAGCRRVEVLAGARTPENRIVCGAEGADLGYVQFSEGYWSQPFYDRRNGAWDMNDWPKHGTGAYRASPVTFGWLGMRNRRMRPCVDHY
ncbi:hypothetical protein DFJ74DRAFT_755485 [Hyaloraphidium curvatum]|nr:hypothetical protein DFJ74DRAFT_755485 [Hyaloraphidium curvatum]